MLDNLTKNQENKIDIFYLFLFLLISHKMESIEQGLLKLQQQKDADTKKYQLLFAKSVIQVANKSNKCAKNQARQLKKIFSEL